MLDPRVQVPALLALTALALVFAWQARQPFALDLGAPNDDSYLAGFHGAETTADGALTFRWTRERATLAVPGYGATAATLTLRLQGARPGGPPLAAVAVAYDDGARAELPLSPELRDYELPVPASAFRDGGLRVTVEAPTYRPPGDARDLGVVVDRVALRDAGAPRGLVMPPLRALGPILLAALAAYATVGLLLRSAPAGALAGWGAAAALLVFALRSRPDLALFGPDLARIVVAAAVATILVGAALRRGRRAGLWSAAPRALGGAALIAGAQLLALLLGMRHPQFRSSDLLLNVHRLEFVERGEWIFTLALPGPRALQAPYPPAFYAAMLPFAALVPDKALLVQATAALAVAAGALLTFALARRVTGEDAPALWAAGAYATAPIAYGMASAGNFANLFGQGLANAALLALILTYGRWRRPAVAAGLTAALTLALLGHFGVALALLVAVPILIAVLAARRGEARGQALALAGSFALAILVAYALYYRHHSGLLLGHLGDILAGRTNARGGADEARGLTDRLRGQWLGALSAWGRPALPLALAGVNLLRHSRPSPALTLTLGWLAGVLPFATLEVVAGLSVRYHLFVLPALAVAAGWALWRLWGLHRWAGPALATILGLLWLWQGLAYWVERVLHAYH